MERTDLQCLSLLTLVGCLTLQRGASIHCLFKTASALLVFGFISTSVAFLDVRRHLVRNSCVRNRSCVIRVYVYTCKKRARQKFSACNQTQREGKMKCNLLITWSSVGCLFDVLVRTMAKRFSRISCWTLWGTMNLPGRMVPSPR